MNAGITVDSSTGVVAHVSDEVCEMLGCKCIGECVGSHVCSAVRQSAAHARKRLSPRALLLDMAGSPVELWCCMCDRSLSVTITAVVAVARHAIALVLTRSPLLRSPTVTPRTTPRRSLLTEALERESRDAQCSPGAAATNSKTLATTKPAETKPLISPPRLSRYVSDFEQVDTLGHGGFGVVYRCRAHLDGQLYAIKKILLEWIPDADSAHALCNTSMSSIAPHRVAPQTLEKIKEVQVLARISDHPNIVRYFSSWVELEPHAAVDPILLRQWSDMCDEEEQDAYSLSGSGSDSSVSSLSRGDDASSSTGLGHPTPLLSDLEGVSSSSASPSPSSSSRRRHHHHHHRRSRRSRRRRRRRRHRPVASTLRRPDPASDHAIVLFLQQQLCGSQTLRDWLDDSSRKVNRRANLAIFAQIVQGLAHVHAHGVVHRDLKPENIFLEVAPHGTRAMIGDFGLATLCGGGDNGHGTGTPSPAGSPSPGSSPLAFRFDLPPAAASAALAMSAPASFLRVPNPRSPISGPPSPHRTMTKGLGSALYASPEQLGTSDPELMYTVSADIFSLALVLVEMFLPPFGTHMERYRVLSRARTGVLPDDLCAAFPQISAWAKSVLVASPDARPAAVDILFAPILTGAPESPAWSPALAVTASPIGSPATASTASPPLTPTYAHHTRTSSFGTPPLSPSPLSSSSNPFAHALEQRDRRIAALEAQLDALN